MSLIRSVSCDVSSCCAALTHSAAQVVNPLKGFFLFCRCDNEMWVLLSVPFHTDNSDVPPDAVELPALVPIVP